MGNCFSRGKGRPPPQAERSENYGPATQKQTQEINWDMCADQCVNQRNGNSLSEPVREKSVRTFYTRVGRASDVKIGKTVSETRINNLFDIYKDTDEEIQAEGIERLCADLNLSPDEYRVLLLAWKLDASQMCRFTREEFVKGCRAMHVDSLKGIQNKLAELETEVREDQTVFKDLYRFTFRFGLDSAAGQRILAADMAMDLWRLVFCGQEPAILQRWLRFLQCHPHIRGIPRDTWYMFLNLAEAVGDDLSTYNDAEAWPSLFDDFVEFENDQANQNISKEKEQVIKAEWDS
ncbi:DCN1-like protein 3 [Macrosteles quadrilineatus]|uniref:DCN1-like protein 3 n=1 Tax=Macrosteles quadrilineatus TaxID=74068 RepID=UPI0023E2B50A|nr:DCN1-like protein 3 [Macrosteles quadrilineatus]